MSNITVPSFLQNSTSRGIGAAMHHGSSANIPYISLDNARFTPILADGTKESAALEIDVVIVDVNPATSKTFYEGAYNPNSDENKGPICFSFDGIKPNSKVAKPQNSVCSTCPRHAWGSKINPMTGKPTRDCQDSKRLAVLIPHLGLETVFLLRVPPASLKNISEYAKSLSEKTVGNRRIEPSDVITRVSFDARSLVFKAVDYINESIYATILDLDKKDTTAFVIGTKDDPSAEAFAPAPRKEAAKADPLNDTSNYVALISPPAAQPAKEKTPSPYETHFQEVAREATPTVPPSPELIDRLEKAFTLQVG